MPLLARGQIYVDQDNASGTADGTSWDTAYSDLQTALSNASSNSEIWIAQGVYKPTDGTDQTVSFTITGADDGLSLYGGFSGTESDRSARQPTENRTVLSGDLGGDDNTNAAGVVEDHTDLNVGDNSKHVLYLDGTSGGNITSATLISGVTITAGRAYFANGDDPADNGGGLFCDGSGGGNQCSPTLSGVVFSGNVADREGGAIYNSGSSGGSSSPAIQNGIFRGNLANMGAAVFNNADGGTSSPAVARTFFVANDATYRGGALYNSALNGGTSSPSVTNTVFANNSVQGRGGAIYTIGYHSGSTSNPIITNSTIAGNSAIGSTFGAGGGMRNRAGNGGTVEPQIANTIFWGNTADAGADEFSNGGSTPSVTHSIIQGGVNGSGVSGTNEDNGGNLDTDPSFLDDTAPAGTDGQLFTRDDGLNLSDGSPALDVGSNSEIPSGVTSDVTGSDRTQDRDGDGTATVNIGAYELPSIVAPTATTKSPSNVTANGTQLVGSVNPGGAQTDVSFQVIETATGNLVFDGTASESPLNGATEQQATRSINGLAPQKQYKVKVAASNAEGTAEGDFKTFTTPKVIIAIRGGGAGGLDRSFTASPSDSDAPIGIFEINPGDDGVTLTEVTTTLDASGARGVDQVSLWISDNDAFSSSDDTQLQSISTSPTAEPPSSLTFDQYSRSLPSQSRYLFVTVTLTSNAEGDVTGSLSSDSDLKLTDGQITTVNGTDQSSFSELPLSNQAATLPVEMVSFQARIVDDETILRWRTASELNNAGFDVQRRTYPEGAWTNIGYRDGAGTTSSSRTYRFRDRSPSYTADSVSYRLRQVDTDGTTQLTDPVTITRNGPDELELLGTAPNPAVQRAIVRYAVPQSVEENVELRLYDVLGRRVHMVEAPSEAGRHETRLSMDDLSSGVYVLQLRAGGQAVTRKLTVVR